MPSDPRLEVALRAVAGPIDRYRSAVVSTVEEVRGYLESHPSGGGPADGGVAARLGAFAAGRIDFDRFSSLLTDAPAEDPEQLRKVEKAFDLLRLIASGDEELFRVRVKSGARLRDVVAARLGEVGRAFAAARLAGMARAGSLNSTRAEDLLLPLGFERWNAAERQLAPPLVVELAGDDLHAGDLAEFLDGSVKIVLVVEGDAAPAPLVRLITPSTFVLQTADETGLDRFTAAEGPAVAALLPESAARFIHDPARGMGPGERLEVLYLPEGQPKQPVGGISVRQQSDELEQLRALSTTGAAQAAPAAGAAAAGPVESAAVESPVDKLAAWLLSQADLSNLE